MAKMKKFEFYLMLRDLGIKEKHAISMTKQAKVWDAGEKSGRCAYVLASEAIELFSNWDDTEEGCNFWCNLHNKHWDKEQA